MLRIETLMKRNLISVRSDDNANVARQEALRMPDVFRLFSCNVLC